MINVINHRIDSECKKYKYIGGHEINDKKLNINKTYYIRENNWGSFYIINESNEPIWVLSKLVLETLFEEVN